MTAVVPFPFAPNWATAVKDVVEYKTQILPGLNGSEQRYRLRQIPRRKLSFDLAAIDSEVQTFDSLLWALQGGLFGVPWWPDGVLFSGSLAAGATAIAIDTTDRLFPLAGHVMVWSSSTLCEVQTVGSVSSGLVSCSPLSNSYVNPIVLPVFLGRIESSQDVERIVRRASRASVKFACEVQPSAARPSPPAASTTAYGFEVLDAVPNWTSPTQSVRRLLDVTDKGYGPILVVDRGGLSFQGQDFRWVLANRDEAAAFRNFLDRRQGRAAPFWVPTWREDLTLAQDAASGSAGIVVRDVGYASRMFPDAARRYIAIRTPAGGWIYRKVLSASAASGVETLGLDASNGVALPAGTVVSFLVLCRLDDDAAEIAWETSTVGQATLRLTEIPREAPA